MQGEMRRVEKEGIRAVKLAVVPRKSRKMAAAGSMVRSLSVPGKVVGAGFSQDHRGFLLVSVRGSRPPLLASPYASSLSEAGSKPPVTGCGQPAAASLGTPGFNRPQRSADLGNVFTYGSPISGTPGSCLPPTPCVSATSVVFMRPALGRGERASG